MKHQQQNQKTAFLLFHYTCQSLNDLMTTKSNQTGRHKKTAKLHENPTGKYNHLLVQVVQLR